MRVRGATGCGAPGALNVGRTDGPTGGRGSGKGRTGEADDVDLVGAGGLQDGLAGAHHPDVVHLANGPGPLSAQGNTFRKQETRDNRELTCTLLIDPSLGPLQGIRGPSRSPPPPHATSFLGSQAEHIKDLLSKTSNPKLRDKNKET